jgi:hypothetical protein
LAASFLRVAAAARLPANTIGILPRPKNADGMVDRDGGDDRSDDGPIKAPVRFDSIPAVWF